ncbi:gas vesicle protein V [Roseibium sp. CAU 1637]|uniref:Gas vesicle protein V n=1 Tax=Roseibium limicola TaxID=2816037 RepID=A0A939EPN6_9HYPH|nr:gas vesicle protein V [Roseibium limicola]MBO0346020.1 gas vesicle protein V [Roseibium limicola]
MSHLTNPSVYELSETAELRRRRKELLGLAHRRRHRLSRLPELTGALKTVTTELLKQELVARTAPEPLGDAGAVGDGKNGFSFYKD